MLHLTLFGVYFRQIYNGIKTHEYRTNSEYYRKRIFIGNELKHNVIHFVNGYGAKRPWMNVEIKAWTIYDEEKTIDLHLGKIIETGNMLEE